MTPWARAAFWWTYFAALAFAYSQLFNLWKD